MFPYIAIDNSNVTCYYTYNFLLIANRSRKYIGQTHSYIGESHETSCIWGPQGGPTVSHSCLSIGICVVAIPECTLQHGCCIVRNEVTTSGSRIDWCVQTVLLCYFFLALENKYFLSYIILCTTLIVLLLFKQVSTSYSFCFFYNILIVLAKIL